MNVDVRLIDGVAILDLKGRFDNATVQPVAEQIEKLTTTMPANVVVNLASVDFIDSTALSLLVQGLSRCRRSNGEFYLCALQPQVYMIFEITRLDKAFTIFVDEQHALQAFNN